MNILEALIGIGVLLLLGLYFLGDKLESIIYELQEQNRKLDEIGSRLSPHYQTEEDWLQASDARWEKEGR